MKTWHGANNKRFVTNMEARRDFTVPAVPGSIARRVVQCGAPQLWFINPLTIVIGCYRYHKPYLLELYKTNLAIVWGPHFVDVDLW